MDNLHRAIVSVLIDGDDLQPSEITTLLGQAPRLGVSKGQSFTTSHGQQTVAATGLWQYGAAWEFEPDLNQQIGLVLSSLTSDLSAWTEVTRRYNCYVAIGGYFHDWTGGLTLEPGTLQLLAERNLAIDLDLYAPAASA
ncbi:MULTISPECIES: DUF4279 domain-containing protein [Sphingomonas]|uniref:DUF4279 domain-containing protein n=1 Tax=Sphingomonas hengshuiensis TaxID=1609977 RepID=A0A2W4ZBE5_9SPHN|nr:MULTISPECIES: DUF4279 domain-containing protein [Sphingomonas]MDK8187889.1 DUF4279 domain-containing protein [Sphingomonas zeae]MDK8217577.1 DUF4279 domain-containing protein [Sphingomonas sp. UMB7805-LC452B]PZO77269.1 MAG: hypothetical protein DI632_09535 [Sphingomonas hengshuiensis]RSV32500.1 DUF4279 domain-containing protein [Sphingomonas sp. ABOLH]